MATDIQLDMNPGSENYGDLLFDDTKDIQTVSDEESPDSAMVQRLTVGCNLQKGEWALDVNEGVPWRSALGKSPDPFLFIVQLRTFIQQRLGVATVQEIDYSIDNARRLSVDYSVVTDTGLEVAGTTGG